MDLSDEYNSRLQTAALAATRKAAGLPSDMAFHRSMDPELAQTLDVISERVLSLTNRLLGKGKLRSQDDVVDNFHSLVVDPMDQLLEKTDMYLDDVLGKNKPPSIAINPPKPKPASTVIQHAAYLTKPQLSFTKRPDNSDAPWYPTLSHKFNAKVPLGHIYHDPTSSGIITNHPYRYEITHISYPQSMFTPRTPLPPPPLEDTTPTWISTPTAFHHMLAKLQRASEIAVDLEHHSYRSYSGFLCLMQISDRDQDWIVDLLAVRDDVEALNEVFTDPAIVKVFHGAESDIVWLQQDFNLYIVNLFDTFHASKLLEFPRHGLANLLEMYCDYIPDKRYQLADWRIRPLPADMLLYAQSDTHFLLYIYDNLLNALLDRAQSPKLVEQALTRSADTSLRVYTKEAYDPTEGSGQGGWDTLAKKWNKIALTAGGPGTGKGALHREVYRSLHAWRERVAREEDESTRYILQNHLLFLLAEQPHPPADIPSLLGLFRSSVPPVARRRAKELLSVIRDAVKRGLQGNGTEDVGLANAKEVEPTLPRKDVEMNQVHEKEPGDLWGGKTNQASTSHSSLFGFGPSSSSYPQARAQAQAQLSSSLFPIPVPTLAQPPTIASSTPFSTGTSALFGSAFGYGFALGLGSASAFGLGTYGYGGNRALSGVASYANPFANQNANYNHNHNIPPGHRNGHANGHGQPFRDVVAKINRSLVIAPQFHLPTARAQMQSFQAQATPMDETSGMQIDIEIPYVPASQRLTKAQSKAVRIVSPLERAAQQHLQSQQQQQQQQQEGEQGEGDTIVVVGRTKKHRTRQNKRKRKPEVEELAEELAEAEVKAEVEDKMPLPFDFSTAPNILDDNPDLDDDANLGKKRKRQKKNVKAGTFYGDFPAPPKAHSELKSGNQSHTFR